VLTKHQNVQHYGLPELADGVSPARRAQVMAGMFLKCKEKFSSDYEGNHSESQSMKKSNQVTQQNAIPPWPGRA
jgi:hypothetical protein